MRIGRHALVVPGIPHHVILRGNNKRRLFSYPHEFGRMLWLMQSALARFDCALHALTLMANHLHLLITPVDADALAGCVKGFAQRYAQYRNLRRGGSGKVFEARYLSKPVTSERYLATVTTYIELNPVRAGLVGDAGEYAFSTYGLHAGRVCAVPRAMWRPSHWYRSLGVDELSRQAAYRLWVREVALRVQSPDDFAEVERRELPPDTRIERRPNRQSAA